MKRLALFAAPFVALALVMGCHKAATNQPAVQLATIGRRDITVTAQATGTVEPVDTVAVKSQASGLIMVMPVDVGSQVKPGDLLAQIDTRTLNNDYQRAAAAQSAARATLTVDSVALARANALYAQKVITADEHEAAVIAEANARSELTAAQTTMQTAAQNLEYATVRAEVAGTVISKSASVGTVVSSAISTYGGGSTILTIADLTRVRMRALVNETDVGNVGVGVPAAVTVDAFPSRQFAGVVERIEPQATVQNSVTMFPVLVSLQNVDKALLPGMNGEVVIVTQQRHNVLAVPNDAIHTARDLAAAATALGVNPDSVVKGRQIVFVKSGTTWTPHTVRVGVSDFDYSEVLSGLQEGDQVALLGAALIQAQRNTQSDRIRAVTGSGLPGTGGATGSGRTGGSGGGTQSGGAGGSNGTGGGGTNTGTPSGSAAPPPPPAR